MYNYKQLKLGKNGLPTWDSFIPVVMEVITEKEEWSRAEITTRVADGIGLPDKLRNLQSEKYPDDNLADGRAGWALSDLTLAGLLTRPRRNVYKVTDIGKELYAKHGLNLTKEITHAQPAYKVHKQELQNRKKNLAGRLPPATEIAEDEESEVSVERRINQEIEEYNANVASDLLERIREAEPVFFEHLVVDLLSKMGYQGKNGTVTVTKQSRDGGIDGIINQDPLGTSTVYIQAKRYQAMNIVQRPAIDAFYGALSRVHADRGVFITTSSFSKDAELTAKTFSIVLIDGILLTDLMLKYHVGVQSKQNYELFQIDEDYFE